MHLEPNTQSELHYIVGNTQLWIIIIIIVLLLLLYLFLFLLLNLCNVFVICSKQISGIKKIYMVIKLITNSIIEPSEVLQFVPWYVDATLGVSFIALTALLSCLTSSGRKETQQQHLQMTAGSFSCCSPPCSAVWILMSVYFKHIHPRTINNRSGCCLRAHRSGLR